MPSPLLTFGVIKGKTDIFFFFTYNDFPVPFDFILERETGWDRTQPSKTVYPFYICLSFFLFLFHS